MYYPHRLGVPCLPPEPLQCADALSRVHSPSLIFRGAPSVTPGSLNKREGR